VDEVTVYNRALTAGEISAVYGAGAAGKCRTVGLANVPATPPWAILGGAFVLFALARRRITRSV
jgi:hypothetical protein